MGKKWIKIELRRNLIYLLITYVFYIIRKIDVIIISKVLNYEDNFIHLFLMALGECLGGLITKKYENTFFRNKKRKNSKAQLIHNSILLNQPFENLWNVISSPKNFFDVTNHELIVDSQDEDITLNPIVTIYEKVDNKLNPIIKLRTESIYITNNYGKIILTSMEKLVLPNQKMIFSLKKLADNKSFFTLNIKLTEPTKHQVFLSLKKLATSLLVISTVSW